jgi:hypothetical protein
MDTLSRSRTAIELSAQELYYLAALQGGDLLLGVDDPFPGWLTEEIVEEMDRVQARLAERGVVAVGDEGAQVAGTLAPVTRAVAFPSATVLLSGSTPAGGAEQGAIFLNNATDGVGAELARSEDQTYVLTSLHGLDDAFDRIVERWRLVDQPAAADGDASATIPEAVLRRARELAVTGGRDAARTSLTEAGVPEATAAALADTLVRPVRNGAMATVRRGELAWQTGGLAVLEGENGLWRLRAFERDDAPHVEVTPLPAEALCAELRGLLERSLPSTTSQSAGVSAWNG